MDVLSDLQQRGFIEDQTHTKLLVEYLTNNKATCYIGFDPTADSLHVGNLVCIMALAHMQRHGHRPIALVGGGTGLIGDPSGKAELREILNKEKINENKKALKTQLANFIDFKEDKALLLDNAKWLTKLEYIPFLRDIGKYFTINKMIKAEAYKARMESNEGLTFIEFNYMLLQAYDFMILAKEHDCMLQMGGSDQWGNIVAGVSLVHKTLKKQAFGITFPLIVTSAGIKMGKTHKGAVWLDPQRVSPYEYYQFWVNTSDADLVRFLLLFTFLPIDEIKAVKELPSEKLNSVKAVLGYETVKICHGEEQALKALKASEVMFGHIKVDNNILPSSSLHKNIQKAGSIELDGTLRLGIGLKGVFQIEDSIPSSSCSKKNILNQCLIIDLFVDSGLCSSKSEARRLIEQGGAYVNGVSTKSLKQTIKENDIKEGYLLLRAGKKKYHKIIVTK